MIIEIDFVRSRRLAFFSALTADGDMPSGDAGWTLGDLLMLEGEISLAIYAAVAERNDAQEEPLSEKQLHALLDRCRDAALELPAGLREWRRNRETIRARVSVDAIEWIGGKPPDES